MVKWFVDCWVPTFDGEGTEGAEGDAGNPPGTPPEGTPSGERKFTQAEINKILAEDKRKHQDQLKKAMAELENLKTKATMTSDERKELETRLESLSNELLTKEELSKKEKEKLAKKHQQDVEALSAERDTWKNRYTNSTIERSITDAAISNNAFSPEQIIAVLLPNTHLTEVLDEEGKPTGNLTPKVKFNDEDKDGKPVTLELAVGEAVKRMTEIDRFQNLFKASGAGGLGGTNTSSGKRLDIVAVARDAKTYRKARQEGKI